MSERNPLAFISYTHADAEFCRPLYDALCSAGIRPILDERDFLLGDDLPGKVFDQGIGEADAVLIVLSPDSAKSVWQRAEISAATVRSIRNDTRLIPIILRDLGDDAIPDYLQTKLYLRVTPQTSVASAAERIAEAIFGARANPKIAAPPLWAQRPVAGMYGLQHTDELLLTQLCEERLRDRNPLLSVIPLLQFAEAHGISEQQVEIGLLVLERNGYFENKYSEGGTRLPIALVLSHSGLERYLLAYRGEEYQTIFTSVVAVIVNEQIASFQALAERINAPVGMLDHVLTSLDRSGDIQLVGGLGEDPVWQMQPILARRLK